MVAAGQVGQGLGEAHFPAATKAGLDDTPALPAVITGHLPAGMTAADACTVASFLGAGASNASTCLPCIPGTYSNASGVCCAPLLSCTTAKFL
jgi:hypothetical protein